MKRLTIILIFIPFLNAFAQTSYSENIFEQEEIEFEGFVLEEENPQTPDSLSWGEEDLLDPQDILVVSPKQEVEKPTLQQESTDDFSDNIPKETLSKSRNIFRNLIKSNPDPKILEEKFAGSLFGGKLPLIEEPEEKPIGAVLDEKEVQKKGFDENVVYTVQNGSLVQIDPKIQKKLDEHPQKIQGKGWVVFQKNPEDQSLPQSIPLEKKEEANAQTLLLSPPKSAANGSESDKLVTLKGRLESQGEQNYSNIVVRIAGTNYQQFVASDGYFEFSDLPKNALIQLIVWDTSGKFAKRLVSLTAQSSASEHVILLEKQNMLNALSQSFGVKQELIYGAICGKVGTLSQDTLETLKFYVADAEGPYFFNENSLPSLQKKNAGLNGKFCFFNLKREVNNLVVANSKKKMHFQIHTKPGMFEHDLSFDFDFSTQKQVDFLELVDAQRYFAQVAQNQVVAADELQNDWLDQSITPTWAPVIRNQAKNSVNSHVSLSEDKPNGVLNVSQSPTFYEFSSQSDTADNLNIQTFSLFSSEKTQSKSKIISYHLDSESSNLIYDRAIQEAQKNHPDEDVEKNWGTVFVSLDSMIPSESLGSFNIGIHDTWSGQLRSSFFPIQNGTQPQSSRHVRGYFEALPPGHYTLLVTDTNGALKFIETIRISPKKIQIVTNLD